MAVCARVGVGVGVGVGVHGFGAIKPWLTGVCVDMLLGCFLVWSAQPVYGRPNQAVTTREAWCDRCCVQTGLERSHANTYRGSHDEVGMVRMVCTVGVRPSSTQAALCPPSVTLRRQ